LHIVAVIVASAGISSMLRERFQLQLA